MTTTWEWCYPIMPPKIGSHSKAAQEVADTIFEDLVRCSSSRQPTFNSCVLALADKPGFAAALGFEEDTSSVDIKTGAQLFEKFETNSINDALISRAEACWWTANNWIDGISPHRRWATKHGFSDSSNWDIAWCPTKRDAIVWEKWVCFVV